MKLISFGIRKESENPAPSILYIGRHKESSGKFNGLWIRLMNPFVQVVEYVDAIDFYKKTGPCNWVGLVRIRKAWKQDHYSVMKTSAYAPVKVVANYGVAA